MDGQNQSQSQNQNPTASDGTVSGATGNNAVAEAMLAETIKKLEDEASGLLKNAHPLLSMYSVFQGVIIAAVSQVSSSSSSKCSQWVYFFTLSIVAYLLYGVPLAVMAYKYVGVRNQQDRCVLEREKSRDGRNTSAEKLQPDVFRERVYKSVGLAAVLLMLAFNVFVAYACHAMLCGDKHVAANAGCLQVCDKFCNASN